MSFILWHFGYYGTGFAFIIMGLIFAVMFIYVSSKPREYFIRDERSVRNNEKAGYHAFWILLICISILTMTDWKVEILYKDVIAPLYVVVTGSWLFLRWYYDKKGFDQDQ